jgi:hypothetical protein
LFYKRTNIAAFPRPFPKIGAVYRVVLGKKRPNTSVRLSLLKSLLKEIEGRMICISALVLLLGVRSYWYNSFRTFVNEGTIPRHGLCGKDLNRKRKFAEEEEEDLKAFMDNLIFFVEPSATRFVREVTG